MMKKGILFVLIMLISFSLASCQPLTYDEIRSSYGSFIADNADDYNELVSIYNHISSEIVKSTVMIKNTISILDFSSLGSGVIFDEDDTYYYVMTNSHVIGADDTYIHNITVTLVNGDVIDATLVSYDIAYDIAVVKFIKGTRDIDVIMMADENAHQDETVIILGHPNGQLQAMTIGYYLEMVTLTLDDNAIGQVEFPVFRLSAPVQSGSSGSVVINEEFAMVGLVFAGNFVGTDTSTHYSYAIPIEKVYEFLALYPLTGGETS